MSACTLGLAEDTARVQERDVVLLAFLVVNVLGGLGWLAWGLRGLRRDEAADRQSTLQHAR